MMVEMTANRGTEQMKTPLKGEGFSFILKRQAGSGPAVKAVLQCACPETSLDENVRSPCAGVFLVSGAVGYHLDGFIQLSLFNDCFELVQNHP